MTSAYETGMSHPSPDMTSFTQMPGISRSRTQSISSDRPSTISQSLMSPPLSVSPEAAFIAPSGASQIVTNDHDSHTDTWYDQHGFQPSGEAVLVSPVALSHLNNFLDHLLFNFLAASGSTSLLSLRPAVTEVLKPKLAKDAINNADEELREYLGGGDDDEFLQSPTSTSARDWDLELAWKRTRLRCMVYSSLGDMEEEDEDHYMEEGLLGDDGEFSASQVSPAVAIFLTSILEFLGEQALISAGQAAWNRLRVRYEKDSKLADKRQSDIVDRIIIEEVDMERVALDRTLGRLWRAWKKRVRSGSVSIDLSFRPVSRDKMYRMRLGSLSPREDTMPTAMEEQPTEPEPELKTQEPVPEGMDEDERAAAIPLPMTERDVDEIEVPGLVHYSDDESEEEEPKELDLSVRPKSLVLLSFSKESDIPTPTMAEPHTPIVAMRKRANSLPTPAISPYSSPGRKVKNDATAAGLLETMRQADDVPSGTSAETTESEIQDGAKIAEADATGSPSMPIVPEKEMKGQGESDSDSEYEEIGEAQILTSSRISIGGSISGISGRSTSPATSDRSSRPPLTISTLARSGSLRLVDVSSPRTPSQRSHRNSFLVEQSNSSYSRSGNVSRASSVNTQTNPEEHRDSDDHRVLTTSSTSSGGRSRTSVGLSISEDEEAREPVLQTAGAATASSYPPAATVAQRNEIPTVPEDAVMQTESGSFFQEKKPSYRQAMQPIFGSVRRQTPPSPQHSPTLSTEAQQPPSPRAKQTGLLHTPPDSVSLAEDEVGPLPQRYPRQSPRQYNPGPGSVTPAVPEKNSGRYHHDRSNSNSASSGSIGVVTVDRTMGQHKENNEASRPSVDQATVRPKHTPASSVSSHKMRATRGSQDSTATRPEELARNFEELIQSNETIQYTLTPENMRELEVGFFGHPSASDERDANVPPQGSPRSLQSATAGKTRMNEDTRQGNRDRTGTASSVKLVEVRRSTSVTRATGLRSHPVELPAEAGRSPVPMSSRTRGPVPQARDPRVPRESIVEFAEFIRATGPPGAEATPTPVVNTGLKRNPSLLRSNSSTPTAPAPKPSTEAGRPSMGGGSVSRARLQARDATVDNSNDNSDLIDFIRRGPPSSGNPRIPRTVAPFRTTMDSDQLTGAVGGRAMDASLPDIQDTRTSRASTNATELSAPSIQSSVNSQSALLGRMQGTPQTSSPFDDSDMMPTRKQRRVRDPYAIDFSDEEEDDDFDLEQPTTMRRAQPKEESLIDFLRNAPPPAPSNPIPTNLPRTSSMPVQSAPAPKKKASAPSLMARFRQNSSSSASAGMRAPTSARSSSSRHGPPPPPPSVSVSKGYIPIQVNIPTGGDLYPTYPSYGSTSATPPAPSVPSNLASRPSGRVPMKKFEPRDAVSVPSRGTSDLADFLRSSEPPSTINSPPYAAEPVETSGSRLFGRRKKSSAFT